MHETQQPRDPKKTTGIVYAVILVVTQPPKNPKKKLWVGYAVILAIVILSNIFLYPALMQAGVKSVN